MADFAVQQTPLPSPCHSLAISIGSSVWRVAASTKALRPLGRRTRRSTIILLVKRALTSFFSFQKFAKNPYCSASGNIGGKKDD